MKFRTVTLALAAVCSLTIATFAAAGAQRASIPTPFEQAYDSVLDSVRQRYIGTQIIASDWDRLQAHYGKSIVSFEDLQTALSKTLAAAGDSRLKMLSTTEVDQLDARARSSFIGVGLYLDPVSLVDTAVVVESVFTDSTAESAGLKAGDRVTNVDGVSVHHRDLDDISSLIVGRPGTSATLTVVRDGQTISIPVERDLDQRIGISMKAAGVLKAFKISSLNDDGPAAAAGLKKDDVILAIDGKSTQAMDRDSAGVALRNGRPGTKVAVSIIRERQSSLLFVTRDFVEDQSLTIDMRGERTSWKPGFIHFSVKNLDWEKMTSQYSDITKWFESEDSALILDLRSASGNDPDLAAKVASWFVDSGVVLRYESGAGTNKITTTYEITSNAIVKHYSGAKTGDETIALSAGRTLFTKQVIVLVNSETTGTAEALALALQSSGRATVTGIASTGQPTLTTAVRYSFGSGWMVAAQVPSYTLVKNDGGTIGGVAPDKTVSFDSDIVDTAKYQIDGEVWRLHDSSMVHISVGVAAGIIVLMFLLIVRLTDKTSKETEKANVPEKADGAEEADCGCSKSDEKLSDAKPAEKEKPTPRWLVWLMLILALVMAESLFGLSFLDDYRSGPVEGFRSEISVIAYVDNSDIGTLQKRVVEQLSSEYSGAIEFQVIDASVTPELAVNPKYGDIKTFPSISIIKYGYGKDGKQYFFSSSLAGMPFTKRQLVDHIQSLAKSERRFWPDTPIKRVRPATP